MKMMWIIFLVEEVAEKWKWRMKEKKKKKKKKVIYAAFLILLPLIQLSAAENK